VGDGDDEKHLMAILAGQPDEWQGVNSACMAEMDRARERLGTAGETSGRRGVFSTVGTGVSFGGGQRCPMNFSNKGLRGEVIDHLNQQTCFQRIAGFQSCKHVCYFPLMNSDSFVLFSCVWNLGPKALQVL